MRDDAGPRRGHGASLFGYTRLYGQVPGGQAELLRVPQAQYGPIKVPEGPPDDRFLFLSDVLPTAWQAVRYADVPDGGSLAVIGLGPIGEMSCRIAGARRATPVIRVTAGSSSSAWTSAVPTFPVAPVTTTCMPDRFPAAGAR